MKLASLEIIKSIKEHPNADALEIAQVLGWQTIIKKGEYREGDKIVFVVIDTILPNAPWSEFLADKKNPEKPIRLRTIKLRGQHSQGLVLPLSVLSDSVSTWQIGADVGAELGIKKYEKELSASLAGEIAGSFPSYIVSQTDEDNGLSNPDLVEEVLKHPITITKKYDGCLKGDTLIDTEHGLIEISKIVNEELFIKVASFNIFTQEVELKPITNHFNHGEASVWLEIETDNGEKITVTPNHRFWIPSLNCYRAAEDLTENIDILLKN